VQASKAPGRLSRRGRRRYRIGRGLARRHPLSVKRQMRAGGSAGLAAS
jgi:hypothetical protein